MNLYVDASCLVKALLAEDGSDEATRLWDTAHAVRMASIGYSEVRAALSSARRSRRLSRPGAVAAQARLELTWAQVDIRNVDDSLVRFAGHVAEAYALRALDAVHLAAALALDEEELVFATWDARLAAAARDAGLAVAP